MGLMLARVLGRKPADRGPIQVVTAMREDAQKSRVQEVAERHGYAQRLGSGQRQADVLESERRGKIRRPKLVVGDQATVGLVRGRGKNRRGECSTAVPQRAARCSTSVRTRPTSIADACNGEAVITMLADDTALTHAGDAYRIS
jgi:hypothetical protein